MVDCIIQNTDVPSLLQENVREYTRHPTENSLADNPIKGILSWVGHSRTIASQLTEDSIQGMRDSYCLTGK